MTTRPGHSVRRQVLTTAAVLILLVGGVAAADWALIERDGRPPQWYLSCFYQRESRYGEECTFPTAQSPTVVQVKRWSWLPGADTYPE